MMVINKRKKSATEEKGGILRAVTMIAFAPFVMAILFAAVMLGLAKRLFVEIYRAFR